MTVFFTRTHFVNSTLFLCKRYGSIGTNTVQYVCVCVCHRVNKTHMQTGSGTFKMNDNKKPFGKESALWRLCLLSSSPGADGGGGERPWERAPGAAGPTHFCCPQLSRLHTQVWEAVCRRGSKLRRERGGRVTGARSAAHVGPHSEPAGGGAERGAVVTHCSVAHRRRPCLMTCCYLLNMTFTSSLLQSVFLRFENIFKLVLVKAEIIAHTIFILYNKSIITINTIIK